MPLVALSPGMPASGGVPAWGRLWLWHHHRRGSEPRPTLDRHRHHASVLRPYQAPPDSARTGDRRSLPGSRGATTADDAAELAREDPFQFQAWALGLVGAPIAGSDKKGGERGIDGKAYSHDSLNGPPRQGIFSVRAGHLDPAYVRDLRGVIELEGAASRRLRRTLGRCGSRSDAQATATASTGLICVPTARGRDPQCPPTQPPLDFEARPRIVCRCTNSSTARTLI